MNIYVKRRIIFVSLLILMVLIILSAFFGEKAVIKLEGKEKTKVSLLLDKNGSIYFEENENFMKYTIECGESLKKLNYQENKSSIDLTIDKKDIAKLGLNSDRQLDDSLVSAKESADTYLISFKKKFDKNSYINLFNDTKNKIIVLISKKSEPYKYKVVVDPGHGGNDIGTPFGKVYEKDLTLKISKYLEAYLKYNECNVVMTRDKDKWVDLKERPKIANDENADLLVSVHINSNKENIYKGIDTYYYDLDGFQKAERLKLAETVQKEMLKSDNWKDKGTVRQNLAVLRLSNMPSVLVECGFLSNSEDRDKLLKDETLKNFGINISNGVLNYLNQKTKSIQSK